MRATRDGDTFTLTDGDWSNTYPIEDLGKWLEFYRHMQANFPKARGAYDESVRVLEQLAAEVRIEI